MLYLGIDLHRAQMTVSLRNENGDVILRRQVSTRWPKLEEFRAQLQQAGATGEKFIAIVEVCGFHDWLVKWLQEDDGCHMVLVVQPLGRSAAKTDRRDAHLSTGFKRHKYVRRRDDRGGRHADRYFGVCSASRDELDHRRGRDVDLRLLA